MPEKNNVKLPSLRSRYLTLATLVAILFLICAGIASWYINNVSKNNASALAINETVTTTVFELRNSLSHIDMTVNAMLIHPESSHESILNKNLSHAMQLISSLQSNSNISSAALKQLINQLSKLINELNQRIHYLTQQRQKPGWVYPILPYISSELLVPNRNFISSTEQAINEYLNDELSVDETYHQLQELRSLWQKKILNFRAVIVRFAGLNNTEKTLQEIRIDELHIKIEKILAQLKEKQKNDELELQTEASLDIMVESSGLWNKNWNAVKQIKDSNYWRGDVAYLNEYIIPVNKDTTLAMQRLEKTISKLTSQQTGKLSDAAQQISAGLWLLALLAVSFVIAVYLMIEKLVLQPTARISKSLIEDRQEHYFHIEDKSSKEIFLLTSAFNSMRKQIHQRQIALEHQALHDALTGLPNRTLLNDRLSQAIHIMKRTEDKLAVLLLDLDRFKNVNDTLGHHVGDQLLQLVSKRLETIIRNSDTVARLGGDEFAIIAPNTSPEKAINFAHKIIEVLKDVFIINHQNLYVSASIGVSIYPDNGTDDHTLIRHADIAMYVAKYNNLGAVLYEASQDKNTPDNLSLVGDLHSAMEQCHGLSIFYQPQVNLLTLDVIQIEALLRWEHPSKGFIPPEEIIKLAEQTGVIQDLTTWIMDSAMKEYMQHVFKRNIRLSINLSAWNLQDPDLPSTINKLLTRHKMPANMLTLEVTETTMMHEPAHARKVLHELNSMGIILAIDDYGTGFSSLSYLKLLPMQELKIDKSFIFDMLDDDNDAIIVKSTIELAHNLGFQVIAEGVENNETLLKLRSLKCDSVQGYYFSKPQDIHQLINWFHQYQPKIAQ
jgi:diguanylate cyclase (GGDEF)-like protein